MFATKEFTELSLYEFRQQLSKAMRDELGKVSVRVGKKEKVIIDREDYERMSWRENNQKLIDALDKIADRVKPKLIEQIGQERYNEIEKMNPDEMYDAVKNL